jgi:hypothetical protein
MSPVKLAWMREPARVSDHLEITLTRQRVVADWHSLPCQRGSRADCNHRSLAIKFGWSLSLFRESTKREGSEDAATAMRVLIDAVVLTPERSGQTRYRGARFDCGRLWAAHPMP